MPREVRPNPPGMYRKLFDWFRRKPKSPLRPRFHGQERNLGSQGIAAGSLKPADDFGETGRTQANLEAENVGQWRQWTGEEIEQFLYDGKAVDVHSTNVSYFRYDVDRQKMYVGFKNGADYVYDNVNEDEALQAMMQSSKGGYVWDILRGRGPAEPRKPYRRIS